MNWNCLKVDLRKEFHVARAIERKGGIATVPVEIKSHAVSFRGPAKTRRRIVTETPLIPRLVFCQLPDPDIVHGLKYALGLARDATGWPWAISESQMARFMECHSRAISESLARHQRGLQRGKPKKPVKLTSFNALKSYFDDIAGADPETGEILEAA
jgi:hypothetical protein